MSITADAADLNIREQIIRIDRAIAETEGLQAETRKFAAEAGKIYRDRFLAPFVVVAAIFAGLGTTVGPVLVRAIFREHACLHAAGS